MRAIAGVIAACACVPAAASADNLGGTAAVRSWANAPLLRDPLAVTRHVSNAGWALPGDRVFRYLDAAAGPIGGQYAQFDDEVWTGRGLYGDEALYWSIATAVHGDQVTLGISAGPQDAYRVRVDGSPTSVRFAPGPNWNSDDITIRMPRGGWHTVVLQMTGYGTGFLGATVPAGGQLARPRLAVGPRTIFLGDSWTSGAYLGAPFQCYVERTAELLGLGDAWASGLGDTGYLEPGPYVPFGARLQSDVLRWHPGNVIVAGGSNDEGTASQFSHAVNDLFTRIRRALPHVRLIAVGPWNPTGSVPPIEVRNRDIIRAAVRAHHGAFIDTTRWITGQGTTAQPAHDGGNADRYIGPEHHPNPAGYRYIADRLASAIKKLPRGAGR